MTSLKKAKSRISIIAVIAINVVVILALVFALYTRYVTYADYHRWNMPTDTLVFPSGHHSAFCNDYTLSTELEKDGLSNSAPFFDLYESSDNPDNTSTDTFKYHLQGTSGLRVREHRFHHFDLVQGSSINGSVCAEREWPSNNTAPPGIWFYVIRGKKNFDAWRKQHGGYEKSPVCAAGGCLISKHLNDTQFSKSSLGCLPFQVNATGLQDLRAHYIVFYFYPYESNKDETQEFTVDYNLERVVHKLPRNKTSPCQNVAECTANPSKYNILKFNYFQNQKGVDLYNIVTAYSCTPDARIYFAVFFVIPLVIISIISAIAICLCKRAEKRSGLLFEVGSGYGTIAPQ